MNYPCISSNIEMYEEKNGKISVFNKVTGKTYAIGIAEYKVLCNMDGTNSIEELSIISEKYSVDSLNKLIIQFKKIGFLKGSYEGKKINILKIKKGLFNGNKIINPSNIICKIATIIIIYCSIPIFILGLLGIIKDISKIREILLRGIFTPRFFVIIPYTLLVLSLHELGHAVVARTMGANVPEIGVMIYWFMPCAYTNLSGISFIENKYKRILALSSGIFVNLFLSGIGMIVLKYISDKYYTLVLWFSMSNFSIVIANLLVFLKLDGYFILQELLEIKSLREKSFAYLKSKVANRLIILRTNKERNIKYNSEIIFSNDDKLEDVIYIIYGFLAIIYIPVLIFYLGWSLYSYFVG